MTHDPTTPAVGRRRARAMALSTAVVAGLLMLPAPLPAGAAAKPTPAGSRITFGLQPATAKAPDTSRPYFTYSATPGAGLIDRVAVRNYALTPVTVRLYAADAFNTEAGGYDVLTAAKKSTDLGAWLKVSRRTVVVPARTNLIVPFTLRVPRNASPGDHSAGIIAAVSAYRVAGNGSRVAVEQRVGTRVYVRISGPLRPRLTVDRLRATFHSGGFGVTPGTVTTTYVVRNTGNVRLSADQTVRVSSPLGTERTKVPALPELIPGSEVSFRVTTRDVRPGVRLRTTVHVIPHSAKGTAPTALKPVERSVVVWAVPWVLLAVILALLLGLVGAVYWRRRRRSARVLPAPALPKERIPVARRLAAALIAAPAVVFVALGLLVPAESASAETVGSLAVSPTKGYDVTSIDLNTTAPCPRGTNIIARVFGHGFPSGGQIVVGNNAISAYQGTVGGGYSMRLADTMQGFINEQPGHQSLAGTYRFVVTCRHRITLATYGDFVGTLRFVSPRSYVARPSAAVAAQAAPAGNDSSGLAPAVPPSGAVTDGPGASAGTDPPPSAGASSPAPAPAGTVNPDGSGEAQLKPGANVPGGAPITQPVAVRSGGSPLPWIAGGIGALALLGGLLTALRGRDTGDSDTNVEPEETPPTDLSLTDTRDQLAHRK